jgi:uncharacterized protein YbjT (DUF2867 family)
MKILVTGISGYVGSRLAPRLQRDGHYVRGFSRDRSRIALDIPIVEGDAIAGDGLDAALADVDLAYYLLHSMEPAGEGGFAVRELTSARNFADATRRADVERVVYLGGLVPSVAAPSAHLASRLAVEHVLLDAAPSSTALRASIVIGARSRSFRLLVRLIERMAVLTLPAWGVHRTQPIDERDIVELLVHAGTGAAAPSRTLDAVGPDVVSYGELLERIRESMLVGRATVRLPLSATPIASRVAAAIAGEDHALVGPLMESLAHDLLPTGLDAATSLGVRVHSLDAAIEHALREWERFEPLAAK